MTTNPFPMPEWLHLSEVPAYVMERMGSAPLDAIVRAIRDGKVQTRARCKSYTWHDSQTPMDGIAWDDATVDWEAGRFTTPGDHGRTHTFDKVDVLRAGVLGLDWWLGVAVAVPAAQPAPDRAGEAAPVAEADLRRWYVKTWIPQHPGADFPSRDDDLAAAREAFPAHKVSRDRVREIRNSKAPKHWTAHGRPTA
jgi:hypothetical protein